MNNWEPLYEQFRPHIDDAIVRHAEEIQPPGLLRDAVLYSLNAGGKRLRPFLCVLTALLFEKDTNHVMPFAVALEMIHTYSLIHDDLPAMDDDDLRRGKPSSHKKFGEDIAVLAGDSLLNDAFTLLFRSDEGDLQRGGLYLAQAAGGAGMVLGQAKDCRIPESERTTETLDEINRQKTARLISAAVAGSAAWLGLDNDIVNHCELFGEHLGLAFQIADDVLDVVSNESVLGKPVGSDAENNKMTYPALLGIDGARTRATEFAATAREHLSGFSDNAGRRALFDLTDYMVNREK